MVGNPTEKDALMVIDYIENTLDKLRRKRDEQVHIWQRVKVTNEGNSEKNIQVDKVRDNIRRAND